MTEKVHFDGNGDRLVIESGGSIIVRNGGILRTESGAIIDMPESVEFYAGTSFTLSPRERFVRTTSSSPVSIVVPPYASVPFAPGTTRTVLQGGTGQVTFVGGDGVTINTPETLNIAKRYAAAVVMATETQNVWDLMGYLEAA